VTVAQFSGAFWPAIMPQRPVQYQRYVRESALAKLGEPENGRFVDRPNDDFDSKAPPKLMAVLASAGRELFGERSSLIGDFEAL
jgi:hypothetical protein